MARGVLVCLTAVFVLAGCSTTVELPAVSQQHPANPNAAAAPLPPPSDVLHVGRPVAPAPKPEPMKGMRGMPAMQGREGKP